jgi:hypothetical protein
MQWSKIRIRLLSLLAPELKGVIDFHLTNYRRHSDHGHEFWLTVSGKKVFSASYCNHMIEEFVLSRRTGLPYWDTGPKGKQLDDILTRRESHDAGEVVASLRTYLDLDPQVALTSTDPILKALAVIDRRVGKRTLESLSFTKQEHSLVTGLYRIRMQQEQ